MLKKINLLLFILCLLISSVASAETVDFPGIGAIPLPDNVTIDVSDPSTHKEMVSYELSANDQGVNRKCSILIIQIADGAKTRPMLVKLIHTLKVTTEIMDDVTDKVIQKVIEDSSEDIPTIAHSNEPFTQINLKNRIVYTFGSSTTAHDETQIAFAFAFAHNKDIYLITHFTSSLEDFNYWNSIIKNLITELPESVTSSNIHTDLYNRFSAKIPYEWNVESTTGFVRGVNWYPHMYFSVYTSKANYIERLETELADPHKHIDPKDYIDSGETVISGQPAKWLLNTYVYDHQLKYRLIYLICYKDKYYTISAAGNYSELNEDKSLIQEVLESYTILE